MIELSLAFGAGFALALALSFLWIARFLRPIVEYELDREEDRKLLQEWLSDHYESEL